MKKTLAKWRRSKKHRIGIIIILLIIVGVLFYLFEKTRWIMVGAAVLLMAALGMEVAETDVDLGKLIETKSLSESMVKRTENGNLILGATCAEENTFNCDDFADQAEAQEVFEACDWGETDIHGLDRNKDGIACNALLR